MSISIGRVAALASLGILLTGCDAAPEFVVVNETQQTLITRPVFEECAAGGSNRQDYLDEQIVPPMTAFEYSEIYGFRAGQSSLSCVEVMTEDRRLVLAEPYERGRAYNVSDPLPEPLAVVPEIQELPSQSALAQIREDLDERPLGAGVFLVWMTVLVVPLLTAAAFVGFVTVRFFWRQYHHQADAA
jgi:hypothetical protein